MAANKINVAASEAQERAQLPVLSIVLFGRLQSCRCIFTDFFFFHIVYADRAGLDSAQSWYLSFKEMPRVRVLFG